MHRDVRPHNVMIDHEHRQVSCRFVMLLQLFPEALLIATTD
jgi:hypothetical protein